MTMQMQYMYLFNSCSIRNTKVCELLTSNNTNIVYIVDNTNGIALCTIQKADVVMTIQIEYALFTIQIANVLLTIQIVHVFNSCSIDNTKVYELLTVPILYALLS